METVRKGDLYIKVIVAIGIWFTVVTLFGVWEYDVLKAEMQLNEKLLAIERITETAPLSGGVPAYVLAMFSWTAMIFALGWVWGKVLFPHRNLLERMIFSLVFGVFVMPISIFIPFFIATASAVFATLFGAEMPAYYASTIGSETSGLVGLFVMGHEQIYEFTNVFAFFVAGLVLLGLKKLRGQKQ